ncbi:outer membrane lipoprotein-sorting protein [Marinospirillum alkaliphilum]|uniref:Outer membrane lipoprotein-sorting protein n=1 Tax=Marinospirillum alkaliphilum DSM 21637 TaxID=1122209 RepID=A0A1K1VA37_9GAMM|nr:outer membrane lipoprotein-sorting protein [Marinospirillum alkaliphilum]SFX21628.1 Outer membrane lipoprotein-sorting protein [Marinospirillum alkaliphilum DSM 21637]
MNLLKITSGLVGGFALLMSGSLVLAAPPVSEIIERANQASYYAGRDGRSEARMRIEDNRGRTQTRQFSVLRKNVEGSDEQKYLVVFSRPSEFRGTVFLVHKNPAADDDRWLYLPDLDLVRRIAPGDKRTSFVGAHIFYEDISGRNLNEDRHELLEETDQHYVLKSTPKAPGSVEFASFQTWIDKETFLPVRIEYTNAVGEVYRIMENANIEVVDGYPTPMMMRVQDLQSGGNTVVQFRGVSYDLGIPDAVFTERSLRNPPAEWLDRR